MLYNLFAGALCWAIDYSAFNRFITGLQAFKDQIVAGPVDEAERDGLAIQKVNNIAVITLTGVMVKSAPAYYMRYGIAGTLGVKRALEAAMADNDITHILMRVDSPGGSVAGVTELAQTVKQVNAKKPIVVQVEGTLASAAVWATAHATAIYANKLDMIGSLGARTVVDDTSKMFEAEGVRRYVFDTGEFKSAGIDGVELTEAQQAYFQSITDGFFAEFYQTVKVGRKISDADLKPLVDGRMFFATEAKQNGLIDGIQSFEKTLAALVNTRATSASSARNRMRAMALNT